MNISEKFFLLAFDTHKLTFNNWYYNLRYDYGLCGALVFDLILSKRLIAKEEGEFEEDKNVIIEKQWVTDLLSKIERQKLFSLYFGKKQNKNLKNWLKVIKIKVNTIKQNIKVDLKHREIIGEIHTKVMGIKLFSRSYLIKSQVLQELKNHLEKVILEQNVSDIQALVLLRLIKGAKVTEFVFAHKPPPERKELEVKLTQLFENDEVIALLKRLIAEEKSGQMEDMSEALDILADAIASIGEAVDGVGDGGSDGGGDGGGGDGGD
ncbi:MAG: GPP34 family phosphoprotein [Thermoflexibacter sp.]|jgi:hypothetical protein|nr:GPP34 family phosphoprotein [Thermoflexibacter sp.]